MLEEIICDEFKSFGKPRGAIRFKKGLNIVRGGEQSDNSIGKSTFLLVVDFCFGGNTFTEKTNFGGSVPRDHVIKFKFVFAGPFYFARTTGEPEKIYRCNEEYVPVYGIWTKDEFTSFLKQQYGLEFATKVSFREFVSRYARVYGKGNYQEELPLRAHANESPTKSIENLVKDLNLESETIEEQKAKDDADKKKNEGIGIQNSGIFNIKIPNREQAENNEAVIVNLERKKADMIHGMDFLITQEEISKANELNNMVIQIEALKRNRKTFAARLQVIMASLRGDTPATISNISRLKEFFPEINEERILEIERYHNKLEGILEEELAEEREKLEMMIEDIDATIVRAEGDIRKAGGTVNVSIEKIDGISELNAEIAKLKTENSMYEELKEIKKEAESANAILNAAKQRVYERIEDLINGILGPLSDSVDPSRNTVAFRINSKSRYSLWDGVDGGMGRGFVVMILFDLAMLRVSQLPAIIHDSLMYNNIETPVLERIIETYSEEKEKQIFIAYDKQDILGEGIEKLIEDRTRIQLSEGGNELYGGSWSKRTQPKRKP